MQKVRIKKAPQLGEQVDYSFYDSRYRNMGMGGTPDSEVKTTMGPVPREEANIEVELGEVVVGDTNQDGFLELFTFTGKPHSKGGTPVNIPPGSFIFSNTKKLFIKDESLLKELFGLPPKKGGYSPAEIAKKYQINDYIAKLKAEDSDNLTKRTAQTVLDKNLEKLGELALIQESMKGFPDGIPAIALAAAEKMGLTPDALKEMQGQGQPQQQQMMPQEGMMPPQGSQEEMMEPQQEPMTQEMMEGMMRRGGRVLKRYQGQDGSSVVGEDEKKQAEKEAAINAGMTQLPSLQEWAKLHQRPGPYNDEFFGMYNAPGTVIDPATGYKTVYTTPTVGTRFFVNDTSPLEVTNVQPEKIISNWNLYHPMNRDIITVKDQLTGQTYDMSEAEFMMLVGTGSNKFKNTAIEDPKKRQQYEGNMNVRLGSKYLKMNPEFTTLPNVRTREIQDEWGNKTGLNLSSGDRISYAGKNYDVITPYGENTYPYKGIGWSADSWKKIKDTFDNTQGIVLVKGEDGKYDYLEGEDVAAAYKSGMPQLWSHLPGAYLAELATPGIYTPIDLENSPESTPMESGMTGSPFASEGYIDQVLKQNPDTTVAYDTKKDQTIISTQKPLKVEEKAQKKKKKVEDKNLIPEIKLSDFEIKKMGGEHHSLPYYMSTFEMGGILPFYQEAGITEEPETYGPTMKPKDLSRRTEAKINPIFNTSTTPKQEKYIGDNSKGESLYQQPNGDIYIKERGTGYLKAIKYANGDIGNITSEGIIERRPILKDDKGQPLKDKNGNIRFGDPTNIDVVNPKQAWNDTDWKGEYMDDVKVFESLINDPKNQNLRDAMYEEYKKIAAVSPNSKELLALSKEDAIATMIEGNRQMSTIQSAYKDQPEFLTADRWDRDVVNRYADEKNKIGSGINRLYNATARKLGFDPMTDVQGTAYQAMYQAAQKLAKTDEYKNVFQDFDINPVGVNDQQTLGQAVSPVEGILGNTTIGQLMRLRSDYKPKEVEQEVPPKETPKENPELSYYCVKGADGKGNIVSVKKGEAAPVGATTAYATADEAERACIGTPKDLVNQDKYRPVSGEMWGPDKYGIMAAMSQLPAQDYSKYVNRRNVATPSFAYALESPDTFIQAANSQAGKVLDYLGNTTAANVAMASNFNNLGELGKGIGDVQNRNIGTVNDAAYKGAALFDATNKYNQTNNAQTDQLMGANKRDYDNGLRLHRGAIDKAIMKGWGNVINTNLLEQSVSNQFSSDRNIGQLSMIPGTGLDPTNMYTGAATNTGYSDMMGMDSLHAAAQKAYQDALKATGNEKVALKAAETVYSTGASKTSGRSAYGKGPYAGMTFPSFSGQ